MVETKGVVAAVEAADAMLKAAQVELAVEERVGGGLVAVIVTGEVGAVKASVDAGAAAAARVGAVISTHVIPRPADDVATMLAEGPWAVGEGDKPSAGPATPAPQAAPQPVERTAEPTASTEPSTVAASGGLPPVEQLEAMSVPELRTLARQTPGFGMDKAAIRSGHKDELIAELLRHGRS